MSIESISKWPVVRLGDHIDLLAGFPFKSAEYVDGDDDIRLLRGDNVAQGDLRWEGVKRWRRSESDEFGKYALEVGDVVLAMDRPWIEAGLKYAWVRGIDVPCLLVQRVARMRGMKGLSTEYLRYVIGGRRFSDYIKPIVTGVNVPHISAAQIEAFRFNLPPAPTQRKITSILGAYDDLIENNARRLKIQEEMARTIYREWFVEFRPPSVKLRKATREEERVAGRKEIPDDWRIGMVGDIAGLQRGRSYRSEDLADDGGVPFLNLKCIERDGGFRRSGIKRFIGEYKTRHVAKKGHILVAVTDMTQERCIVARTGRVPTLDSDTSIFSMDLVRVDPKANVHSAFVYCFLRFSSFGDEVKQYANGVNVLHLAPERISEYRLIRPPLAMMARFSELVAPCLALIDKLETQIENLKQTRDFLLPRLMSGEVGVAKIEIASADEQMQEVTQVDS